MKKHIVILLAGIFLVLLGVLCFIKGVMLARLFMISGVLFEAYAVLLFINRYKIIRKH